MRIGIFSETYTPYISGLVTSEIMLKKALEKKGHIVYVITANLTNFKYEYDEKERVLRIPEIPTGIYDSRLTSIYPIQAVNIVKGWKLDVIHSQTEFAIGTFARLFAKQYNIPLVHTYHTMYEDYIHYITKGYFQKSSKKLVEYFTKFYCETTATELIVPTHKTYKLFKEKYKFEKNVHIIPTGIEVERFFKENIDMKKVSELKKKLSLSRKDFIIIFVGRLAQEKNVEFLLESQKDLADKFNNIKLLIVGDGPDKEKYEDYVEENHLKNVIFTGKVDWEEMPYYYHCANILATASKTETQGLTVIEAMAGGIVPVCIKDESFVGTVVDELNGRIFQTKEEYLDIVIELSKNKEKKDYFARQARIQAEHCGASYYADQVLDVYRHAIMEKKKYRYGFISRIYEKIRGRSL